VLPDPDLAVLSGQTVIATNAGWGAGGNSTTATLGNVFTQVGAFPFASAGSHDDAIYENSRPPGAYTMRIDSASGSTGTLLAEIYDATAGNAFTNTTPRLVNVSVLKAVAAGDALTAGFVIGGSTSVNVLVRAIGPTLALPPFSLAGTMASPRLELFDNTTGASLAVNSGWGGTATLSAAFAAVGAFLPANPGTNDAALLMTLAPGQYSAQVRGADGGLVIVEVYAAP
jgi:hypothetical protein